jgi:hypothetical protein
MIELGRVKRWLAVVLAVTGVLLGLLVLRQAADAILRAATGADPASVFNEAPAPPSELVEMIEWLPDRASDGRAMEPATRRAITDAYARALAALDRAGRGDAGAPLREYFGGTALTAALDAAGDVRAVETSTFHLRHDLELGFYSDDGAIVAVSAPVVELARVIGEGAADSTNVRWSDETWRFVMILEDGNWRVHQLEIAAVDARQPSASPIELSRPLRGVNTVTVNDVDPTWSSYDPVVGAAELDIALDLGLDTVRVFVAGPEFPDVDTDAIASFLDFAADRDISVVPVLFDGSADHGVANWRNDSEYVDRVVGELAGHPAIVMWDVKNEPDLDDARSGGAAIVDARFDRVAALVRRSDPFTPITIGWSSAAHATRALPAVDVVSFHHFDDADALQSALRDVQPAIGDRQVVVSEFGRPAWVGFVRGSQSAAQAGRVSDLVQTIDRNEIAGSMVWVLRDPDRPIEEGLVAGRASASYGLLEADGTERPSAAVIRSGGAIEPSGPSVLERLRSWPMLGALPLLLLSTFAVGAVRARRRRLIET